MHYELCIEKLTTNHYAFAFSFKLLAFSSAKRLIMHYALCIENKPFRTALAVTGI
jgi:hypothetical protein